MSTFHLTALAVVTVLFSAACSATTAEPTGSSDEAVTSQAQPANVCKKTGQFAFTVAGDGLAAHAGKTIAASAIEPQDSPHDLDKPAAFLSTQVGYDGRVELGCERGLTENMRYPSYAVWLDQNGDGECGAGDLASTTILYGWNFDVSVSLEAPGTPVDSTDPHATHWGRVEDEQAWGGQSFCQYYGFPR